MADVELKTAPADFRFPTTNQTRHCFTRYVEFHKCVNAKGEESDDCMKFAKYYRSLCPGEWVIWHGMNPRPMILEECCILWLYVMMVS
ncbi:Cytochrome c oxidase subunit 6b [Rhynchospora pubera]|uniref:Cytochrome c oxidase subunit 6b n=1 Tax=Rhynchospora pubera TaxID=906938 RepID=A0AAV8HMN5_9POAL|nr:Cytochrome c oxidase subunit 6b [Rhynchospora pubera]